MATPTREQLAAAGGLLIRAQIRFDEAAAASGRQDVARSEFDVDFDDDFDGIVTGIFDVADAFGIATASLQRGITESEQAARVESVVTALQNDEIPNTPDATRLTRLHSMRDTPGRGESLGVRGAEAMRDALIAGRAFLSAVRAYLSKHAIDV